MEDSHTISESLETDRLDPAVVRRLSQLKPWLSVGHILLEYLFIISSILIIMAYPHPVLYIVGVMWISARQHAIAILLHEASHYRILKNKSANDLIGEVLLGFPLFVTVRSYRNSHNAHHRYMNTDDDPDWVSKETPEWEFPKSRKELVFMLAKIALAGNILWMIKLIAKGGRSSHRVAKKANSGIFVAGRIGYYAALCVILTYFGWWPEFFLFWIVPMFTWLQVILRIRSIAEHFGLEYDHELTGARTTYPSLFDRLFLVSKNVWYHLDHHLYPSVPFFNLPLLHEELNKLPVYRERAHVTRGYLGVLKECAAEFQ